ncbi:DUF6922 domain-containing protein [Pleomorphovibrio marinus]|uniref:DUF6922 domain-containing protein n=1 Tax=Pleomorphovibrio marinus TaxID=2164132 RepID=UPI000E0AB8B1|nr:hypothetical protein [Pleomorphovibrio marinus]
MKADSNSKQDIYSLSSHLFWDTPIEDIDWYQHRAFIVERVMGYGSIEDWEIIKKAYSKEEMREIVIGIRVLDDFSIAFLSLVLDLPKEEFRCYTERQYQPSFWHY